MSARFQRVVVEVTGAACAERLGAEAFAAGAVGLEECEAEGNRTRLVLYAPFGVGPALRSAVESWARTGGVEARVDPVEAVEEVDWSERWREGLDTIAISDRLAIRPSFVEAGSAPATHTLVIDPGQAFGTGGHASTRLALRALDALPEAAFRDRRVLDVGTGTGVLALAALALGARHATGIDIDPLATRAASDNAAANGWRGATSFVTGSLACLGTARFELLLANLLRTEVLPLLPAIAEATAPLGIALFSGLLAAERSEMDRALRRVGLEPVAHESETDATDCWLSILTRRH